MQRLRVRFTRDDAVKFISHLDIIRLWERAFRRAGIELALSEGFSPRPRLSLAAPLSVGITSTAELMDIVVASRVSPHWFADAVGQQLPPAIAVQDVYQIAAGVPSLQSQVRFAEYEVDLDTEKTDEEMETAIAGLLDLTELSWHHDRDTGRRHYDLRALIDDVWLAGRHAAGWTIGMKLRCDSGGSGRPEQVAVALGFPGHPLAIRRVALILSPQKWRGPRN